MRYSLQSQCSDFIYSRDIIAENLKFENRYMIPVCANIFAFKNIEADLKKLKDCRKILERDFSSFRFIQGPSKLALITLLAISDEPEEKFTLALEFYKKLKTEFFDTEYLPVLAMILADITPAESSERYIRRGKEIFNRMKAGLPLQTSAKDIVFSVLMSFSFKTDDELISELIYYYNAMQNIFIYNNSVQSMLPLILLTEGTPDQKCEKINYLYNSLKQIGKTYGLLYELPILGAAAMLPAFDSEVIEDIIEVDEYLSAQKSYGAWGVDNNSRRLMHALMLVINDYSESKKINYASIAAITNTLAMISAEEVYAAETNARRDERARKEKELRSSGYYT